MKPLVFIGSSREGLDIANAIQQGLQGKTFPKVWTQNVFAPSSITIDALLKEVAQNDFGVFVMTADDVAKIRAANYHIVRDNVLFESALFMGRYGRQRVFLVKPMNASDFHIPTDLLGLTFAEYDPDHAKRDVKAAVGPPCTDILTAITKVPNYQDELVFTVSLRRGVANYPLKVWVDITNHGKHDIVLRANYFKYKATLRQAPNAVPLGNPAKEEFGFHFPGHGMHDQLTYLLRPGEKPTVWIGVDPAHRDDEIRKAINDAQVAELHMTCSWLSETDVTVRNYAKEV